MRCPLVCGAVRPVLFVPEGPAPAAAPLMLAHELTHIARHDVAFKLLLAWVRALHWFNPAVWLLAAQAGQDLETACDRQALAGKGPAYRSDYADALLLAVRMAGPAKGRAAPPVLSTGFAAGKKAFKRRLAALWDETPKRRGTLALAAAVACAALMCGLAACGAPAAPAASTPETAPGGFAGETTAPEPAPTPVPDRSGAEEAWPGTLSVRSTADLPNAPAWLETFPETEYGGYCAASAGRAGFAVAAGGGTVECYLSQDGGAQYESVRFDASGLLGQQGFQVRGFQMVSDSTGFLLLCLEEEDGYFYDTTGEIAVLRTRDGCQTWRLMGRHSCPEDAEKGSWYVWNIYWMNENVGIFCPHTRYDAFDVWRTLDGGASWQRLEIDEALRREIPYEEVRSLHTCYPVADDQNLAPGAVRISCNANNTGADNGSGQKFWLVSADYGETWSLRDCYLTVQSWPEGGISEELKPCLNADGWQLTLPEQPAGQEVLELTLTALRRAQSCGRLESQLADPGAQAVLLQESEHRTHLWQPCRASASRAQVEELVGRVFTSRACAEEVLPCLFEGPLPRLAERNGALYASGDSGCNSTPPLLENWDLEYYEAQSAAQLDVTWTQTADRLDVCLRSGERMLWAGFAQQNGGWLLDSVQEQFALDEGAQ